jgi:hypothetical protein
LAATDLLGARMQGSSCGSGEFASRHEHVLPGGLPDPERPYGTNRSIVAYERSRQRGQCHGESERRSNCDTTGMAIA